MIEEPQRLKIREMIARYGIPEAYAIYLETGHYTPAVAAPAAPQP